jgi:threonine/homoserine/homoserine lactone efflux protein
MSTEILTFFVISAVVICTPGPDTLLTVRNTLAGGRRSGVMTAAGVSAGQAIWTVAASLGIAALVVASEPAFLALRLAGAAYLVFLGGQTFVNACFRPKRYAPLSGGRHSSPGASFRQGLISNLGNPKMAAFFTSLLPQFAPNGSGSLAVLLCLGTVFCLMTLGWLTVYAFAVARTRGLLARSRIRRTLDAVAGTILVAFGIGLATSQR